MPYRPQRESRWKSMRPTLVRPGLSLLAVLLSQSKSSVGGPQSRFTWEIIACVHKLNKDNRKTSLNLIVSFTSYCYVALATFAFHFRSPKSANSASTRWWYTDLLRRQSMLAEPSDFGRIYERSSWRLCSQEAVYIQNLLFEHDGTLQ